MRRYDPDIAYIGQGEYVPEMSEHEDGEYVRYVGHSGAVRAAVRDTQRRMIAALYWRAGAIRLACHTHPYASPMWWGSIADSDAILAEAVRMEDACVR